MSTDDPIRVDVPDEILEDMNEKAAAWGSSLERVLVLSLAFDALDPVNRGPDTLKKVERLRDFYHGLSY